LAHLFRALKAPAAARGCPSSPTARVPRNAVLHLGQLEFLAGNEHVVLLGPPGTGKTH
jgi:DNA replication protein DnaC